MKGIMHLLGRHICGPALASLPIRVAEGDWMVRFCKRAHMERVHNVRDGCSSVSCSLGRSK